MCFQTFAYGSLMMQFQMIYSYVYARMIRSRKIREEEYVTYVTFLSTY